MAYDPEEHDMREVMGEEEWRERAREEMERTYLKTLAVVGVTMEENDAAADAGDVAALGSPPKNRKMVLLQ